MFHTQYVAAIYNTFHVLSRNASLVKFHPSVRNKVSIKLPSNTGVNFAMLTTCHKIKLLTAFASCFSIFWSYRLRKLHQWKLQFYIVFTTQNFRLYIFF